MTAHHDDDELKTFSKEGIAFTGESNWCVVCGNHSQKKRKRDTCNTTYQNSDNRYLSKTLRKVLRKVNGNTSTTRQNLNHLQCSRCHSRACSSCVKGICGAMRLNQDHHEDIWYDIVNKALGKDKHPTGFIGHCCEVKDKIETSGR